MRQLQEVSEQRKPRKTHQKMPRESRKQQRKAISSADNQEKDLPILSKISRPRIWLDISLAPSIEMKTCPEASKSLISQESWQIFI